MQQMNERIIKVEAAGLRDAAIAAAKDDRKAAKFETITRDIGDVKVAVEPTEEAVRYLVRTLHEGRQRSTKQDLAVPGQLVLYRGFRADAGSLRRARVYADPVALFQ